MIPPSQVKALRRRTDPAVLHTRISTAPRGATGDYGHTLAGITRAYLATITAQIDTLNQSDLRAEIE